LKHTALISFYQQGLTVLPIFSHFSDFHLEVLVYLNALSKILLYKIELESLLLKQILNNEVSHNNDDMLSHNSNDMLSHNSNDILLHKQL